MRAHTSTVLDVGTHHAGAFLKRTNRMMLRALGRAIPLAALLIALFTPAALQGQGVTTGAITGRVTAEDGQPIVGAEIQIINTSTGYVTRSVTRENGQFLIQGLEVGGPYTIMIRGLGYQDFVREGIYVRLSQATRVDAQLATRALELQPLDVSVARTADFSPTRQGVTTQISDTLVRRVPTFSRNFVDLIKLSPQVVYPASGAASGAGAWNRFNTITIDGANQSERFNLGSTGGVPGGSAGGKVVSLDAVKEFSVMFTPTDVRQGNFAGMLVNAVTKSGTNTFSGGATFTYRSNEDLMGLNLVGTDLREDPFSVKQYGFHLGGPIIRDRLHFFIAPEWQDRGTPAIGPAYRGNTPVNNPSVSLDDLNRIANIMRDQYNFDVGTVAPLENRNPLTNLFGRLDFQISPEHRLVLRQIINRAEDDSFSRNTGTFDPSPLQQNSGFRFGSNKFSRVAENNSTVAQLYSTFGGTISNELIVGYSTIRDERKVPVQAPEVSVAVPEGNTLRAVTFGTEQFSPNNLLEQKIFEVVNNVTIPMGAHTFTLGGRLDHTSIFNNFAQGTYGVYKFASIEDLAAGRPIGYAVGYPNSKRNEDIPADFRVQVYSLYAQDQWAVNDRLTITAGLRTDIPRFLDKPPQNDALTAALATAGLSGIRTDAVPKTRVLWSPRIGFNYDPQGDLTNQIRGSIGIYTGPPPYILIGNAYANTGLGLVRLSCTGDDTPEFTMDINRLPTACRGQQEPGPGAAGTVGVNTIDPNFKFPQYYGLSAGFDRRLPYNTVLTVEALYRKAINGVLIRDRNLMGPRMVNGQPYTDRNGRVLYADTILPNGNLDNRLANQRYLTTFGGVNFNEGVLEVTNQSEDYNYSISTQLHRRFSDRFEATVAYTYMQSKDVQSINSDRAISIWRNSRQLSTSHDDLVATTSVFERPHRIVAYGTYTLPWGLTDVTLYYEGTSGVPYTYVAQGDLNGDGYSGNDPIYIPRDAKNTQEILIGSVQNGQFVLDPAAAAAFDRFISSQKCLDKQRGSIMERNSCRTPFQHRMDLSIRQSIPRVRGQQVAVQLDIFNFLNFLNSDWGRIKLPTLSPTFNDQRALAVRGRTPGPLSESMPQFTFDNRLYDPETGEPTPFEGRLRNVYQVQLTLRYSF